MLNLYNGVKVRANFLSSGRDGTKLASGLMKLADGYVYGFKISELVGIIKKLQESYN